MYACPPAPALALSPSRNRPLTCPSLPVWPSRRVLSPPHLACGAGSARQTFKNGTIQGAPHVLAGCSTGVANVPRADGRSALGEWRVIPPGGVQKTYISVADVQSNGDASNSVLGACVGHLWIGVIVNRTYANWTVFPDRPCVMAALNPNNASHFIYTHPPITYQSLDGGATFENLNHSNIFHCGIDRRGWLYTAAMGGAFFAEPCGGGARGRPCVEPLQQRAPLATRQPDGIEVDA